MLWAMYELPVLVVYIGCVNLLSTYGVRLYCLLVMVGKEQAEEDFQEAYADIAVMLSAMYESFASAVYIWCLGVFRLFVYTCCLHLMGKMKRPKKVSRRPMLISLSRYGPCTNCKHLLFAPDTYLTSTFLVCISLVCFPPNGAIESLGRCCRHYKDHIWTAYICCLHLYCLNVRSIYDGCVYRVHLVTPVVYP